MRDKVDKITGLLDKYLKEELSPEEKSELEQWVMEDGRNKLLFDQVTDKKKLAGKLKTYSEANSVAIWQSTLQKINNEGKVVVMVPRRRAWLKYAVAAAVVGISVAVWQFIDKQNQQVNDKKLVTVDANAEVKPGTFKAQLILVDGSTKDLNTKDITIPNQGNNEVKVTSEGLVYVPDMKKGNEGGSGEQFNTVSTSKGGEYKFTLPDGSKVWLNAASSLRFPIAFAGNERHVQLTGEAYFEVENAGKIPFIVSINNGADKECDVEVLGTHFNVMAYTDEPGTQTTLLEGSVRIKRTNTSTVIKPGQQADVINKEINVKAVNTEDGIAWRERRIAGDDAQTVLRQIARWYNVEIRYETKPPETKFGGAIPRESTIDAVMKALKEYSVYTRLEGRTLIIM